MDAKDIAGLIHPLLAIAVVFPLIGMVVNYAWQTRQRRLANKEERSSVPASVGKEHLRYGRWLSNAVVGVALVALAYSIFSGDHGDPASVSSRMGFVVLMFIATIASLVILNRARTPLWRGVFATLTGMGLIVLGSQPEVYRRGEIFDFATKHWFTDEWYISHYYYGIAAAMLMIFSLAIFPDIYQDRSHRWRNVHVILNCLALLLFVGQGFTGTRDLIEIPLDWQQTYIEQIYSNNCQPPQPPGACKVVRTKKP